MSRDEIIEMARQAGACRRDIGGAIEFLEDFMLERFAKLVATKAAANEREACAKVCDEWNTAMTDKLAAAIRARGEA